MDAVITGLVLEYRNPLRTTVCIQSMVEAGIMRILVVDNSVYENPSRDAPAYPVKPQGVELVRLIQKKNLGFAAGVNAGLEEIRRNWPDSPVLLLNNDAVIGKDLPGRLLDALNSDTSAAIAYPVMRQQGARYPGAWYQPLFGLISARPLPFSIHYASGCCQLIAIDRIPGKVYDERFFMYGEDVELAWRLQKLGLKQVLVESLTVEHEGSASSGNGSLFYETLLADSHFRLALVLSERRPGLYAAYLCMRFVTLPIRSLIRSFRFRSTVPMKGLISGFKRAAHAIQGPPEGGVNAV